MARPYRNHHIESSILPLCLAKKNRYTISGYRPIARKS
jgi:hypothetical protein